MITTCGRMIVAGLLAVSTVAYADWPRFRGVNGSGYDPQANTPASFTEKEIGWKVALPGVGHSSPVVVGKKIFVTCAEMETAKRYLICLDLDSGKTLWKREYASRAFKQHRDNSFASASPAADGERVYFTFTTPDSYKVYCLDHEGKDVWTYDMGRWESQHGCGCSPVIFEDLLIVPNDQDGPTASTVALDKLTGSEKWKVTRKSGNTSASTPVIYQPAGGAAQVVLTSTANGISGLDAKTGKTVWAVANTVPYRAVGSPVATASLVIGTSGEGGANRSCVALHPGEEGAKIVYKMPSGANFPYVPSPVVKGDEMFLWSDVGTVSCVNVADGKVVWQERVKADKTRTEFYSSPIIAGDKLYNITKEGEVICLAAGKEFKVLGHSQLEDKCFATPAIVGDRLVIRTASNLMVVGAGK